MKKIFVLFLVLALLASVAAAEPVTSYASVQDLLLAAAYKVKPFDASLTGVVHAVVPSYAFSDGFYLFVLVDPDDVSMWSTEDDNFFVTLVRTDEDPFPYAVGDTITVEGKVSPIYSSPVCPYITSDNIIKTAGN